MNKIQLTDTQFYDYIFCPVKFQFLHIDHIPLAETVNMPRLLTQVANRFFIELLNGEAKSMGWVKNIFDGICNRNENYMDSKKIMEGIYLLNSLYEYCRDSRLQIVDINSPFQISTQYVNIVGRTDAIALIKGKKNKYELFVPDFGYKITNQDETNINLRYTMQCLGFIKTYSKELAGIHILHVRTKQDFKARRSREDYLRLEAAIDGVGKGIQNKIIYPHQNPLCRSCEVRDLCKVWIG